MPRTPLCRTETFHCRDDVAQAAGAPWIPDLAGTAAGCDVRANALDRVGGAAPLDFRRDVRFVLTEAVADRSSARRLLLPDALTDIRAREDRPVLAEVHDRAPRVRTKAVGVV